MPVITYQAVPELISACTKKDPSASLAPVCLLYGEELLYKSAHAKLLSLLLPKGMDDPSHESFSGEAAGVMDALERVSTYALLGNARVVTISDLTVFHTRKDAHAFAAKVAKAVDKDQMGKAAKHFLNWMMVLGYGLYDLSEGGAKERQILLGITSQDNPWVEKVLQYCRAKDLTASAPADVAGLLEKTIVKGLPSHNHLMITTEVIDKRRRFYKLLTEQGIIIDCSVPRGQRHADRQAQKVVLQQQAQRMLDGSGKTLSPGAFDAIYERTGFDLRLFSVSLEKVLAFVGGRTHIKSEDVGQVLIRTKEDPIFEFTNALSQRDLPKALFYLNSLLDGDFHALQLLSAMANLIRRLSVAQGFLKDNEGIAWHSKMTFNQFKTQVLPVVRQHDKQLQERLKAWNDALRTQEPAAPTGKPKKKAKPKGKVPSTLYLSTQSASPYPLYQTFISQGRFSRGELEQAFDDLQRCDILIKRGSQQAGLLLERTVMSICTAREESRRR